MELHYGAAKQLDEAYHQMAAFYRPEAPSDGFGHITASPEQLNLNAESYRYAQRWWKEEDSMEFHIGCCDFATRKATVYAIEAARNMCAGSGGRATARKLLQMALDGLNESMR